MSDQLPLQPFTPGQRQVSASVMNRIVDAINYEARTQYDDTIETVGGIRHHFSDPGRQGFWAKLTSESSGQYAWTEQQLNGYTFSDLTYGRSGTTSANYAKDPNGTTGLASGTPIVRLIPGDPSESGGTVSDNWLISGYASIPDAAYNVAGKINYNVLDPKNTSVGYGQFLGAGFKMVEGLGLDPSNTGLRLKLSTPGKGFFSTATELDVTGWNVSGGTVVTDAGRIQTGRVMLTHSQSLTEADLEHTSAPTYECSMHITPVQGTGGSSNTCGFRFQGTYGGLPAPGGTGHGQLNWYNLCEITQSMSAVTGGMNPNNPLGNGSQLKVGKVTSAAFRCEDGVTSADGVTASVGGMSFGRGLYLSGTPTVASVSESGGGTVTFGSTSR